MLQRLKNLVQNREAGLEHGEQQRRVLAGGAGGEGNAAASEHDLIELARQGDNASSERGRSFVTQPTPKMRFRMHAGKPSSDWLSFGAMEASRPG
jgi:hypothetical protein